MRSHEVSLSSCCARRAQAASSIHEARLVALGRAIIASKSSIGRLSDPPPLHGLGSAQPPHARFLRSPPRTPRALWRLYHPIRPLEDLPQPLSAAQPIASRRRLRSGTPFAASCAAPSSPSPQKQRKPAAWTPRTMLLMMAAVCRSSRRRDRQPRRHRPLAHHCPRHSCGPCQISWSSCCGATARTCFWLA